MRRTCRQTSGWNGAGSHSATLRAVVPVVVLLMAVGCGDDDQVVVDTAGSAGAITVQQTSVSVASTVPPPNPVSNAETPADLNAGYAQVYQAANIADADVEKVVVLVPGFLGGAGTFDYMARRIVTRTRGKAAVWATDRRSNALEDQTGFDAAEAGKDPDIAKRYYFQGAEIGGRTFGGFLEANQLSFESEWGVKTHIEDLDALISFAAERYPRAAIFLGGHSLGGSIVPIYAAWDFGGRAGFERLSGLLLFEGRPNPSPPDTAPTQMAYETGGLSGGGGRTSLSNLRSGNPVSGLEPFATKAIYVTAEIVGMRASTLFGAPEALSPDADLLTSFLGLLFGLPQLPPTTNRAVLGFGFDSDFEPLSFVRVSIGAPIGPIGPNPNAALLAALLGVRDPLLAPIDPTATYDWTPPSAMPTPDPTNFEAFARMLFTGPSNFIEWYFPARLGFDVAVTSGLNVQPTGDWRKEVYGMAVTENARVDVPVFAVGGGKGFVTKESDFDTYRDSIAPMLRTGTPRSQSSAGFKALVRERAAHIDVITAEDSVAGQGVYADLVEWMDAAVRLAPRR